MRVAGTGGRIRPHNLRYEAVFSLNYARTCPPCLHAIPQSTVMLRRVVRSPSARRAVPVFPSCRLCRWLALLLSKSAGRVDCGRFLGVFHLHSVNSHPAVLCGRGGLHSRFTVSRAHGLPPTKSADCFSYLRSAHNHNSAYSAPTPVYYAGLSRLSGKDNCLLNDYRIRNWHRAACGASFRTS